MQNPLTDIAPAEPFRGALRKSEIFWLEAGTFGYSRKHAWTDFLIIMEREDEIGETYSLQGSVRSGLPFDGPSLTQ